MTPDRLRDLLHVIRHWLLDAHDVGRLGSLGEQWLADVEAKLDALDEPEIERLKAEFEAWCQRCDALTRRIHLALARRA